MVVLIKGSSTNFYFLPFGQEGRLVVSGSFLFIVSNVAQFFVFCLSEIKIGVVQQLPLLAAARITVNYSLI